MSNKIGIKRYLGY